LDLLGTPLHDDDFKAVMVVQMDVGGRKNHRTGYMLSLCQLLREVWNMVIVDKREWCRRPACSTQPSQLEAPGE
jgi:hypothetical protein